MADIATKPERNLFGSAREFTLALPIAVKSILDKHNLDLDLKLKENQELSELISSDFIIALTFERFYSLSETDKAAYPNETIKNCLCDPGLDVEDKHRQMVLKNLLKMLKENHPEIEQEYAKKICEEILEETNKVISNNSSTLALYEECLNDCRSKAPEAKNIDAVLTGSIGKLEEQRLIKELQVSRLAALAVIYDCLIKGDVVSENLLEQLKKLKKEEGGAHLTTSPGHITSEKIDKLEEKLNGVLEKREKGIKVSYRDLLNSASDVEKLLAEKQHKQELMFRKICMASFVREFKLYDKTKGELLAHAIPEFNAIFREYLKLARENIELNPEENANFKNLLDKMFANIQARGLPEKNDALMTDAYEDRARLDDMYHVLHKQRPKKHATLASFHARNNFSTLQDSLLEEVGAHSVDEQEVITPSSRTKRATSWAGSKAKGKIEEGCLTFLHPSEDKSREGAAKRASLAYGISKGVGSQAVSRLSSELAEESIAVVAEEVAATLAEVSIEFSSQLAIDMLATEIVPLLSVPADGIHVYTAAKRAAADFSARGDVSMVEKSIDIVTNCSWLSHELKKLGVNADTCGRFDLLEEHRKKFKGTVNPKNLVADILKNYKDHKGKTFKRMLGNKLSLLEKVVLIGYFADRPDRLKHVEILSEQLESQLLAMENELKTELMKSLHNKGVTEPEADKIVQAYMQNLNMIMSQVQLVGRINNSKTAIKAQCGFSAAVVAINTAIMLGRPALQVATEPFVGPAASIAVSAGRAALNLAVDQRSDAARTKARDIKGRSRMAAAKSLAGKVKLPYVLTVKQQALNDYEKAKKHKRDLERSAKAPGVATLATIGTKHKFADFITPGAITKSSYAVPEEWRQYVQEQVKILIRENYFTKHSRDIGSLKKNVQELFFYSDTIRNEVLMLPIKESIKELLSCLGADLKGEEYKHFAAEMENLIAMQLDISSVEQVDELIEKVLEYIGERFPKQKAHAETVLSAAKPQLEDMYEFLFGVYSTVKYDESGNMLSSIEADIRGRVSVTDILREEGMSLAAVTPTTVASSYSLEASSTYSSAVTPSTVVSPYHSRGRYSPSVAPSSRSSDDIEVASIPPSSSPYALPPSTAKPYISPYTARGTGTGKSYTPAMSAGIGSKENPYSLPSVDPSAVPPASKSPKNPNTTGK